jgi:hypothetical protein
MIETDVPQTDLRARQKAPVVASECSRTTPTEIFLCVLVVVLGVLVGIVIALFTGLATGWIAFNC